MPVNLRVTEAETKGYVEIYPNQHFGLCRAVKSFLVLRKASLFEIKTLFNENELKCLIDISNGSIFDEARSHNNQTLEFELIDLFDLDKLDKKWELDRESFLIKIRTLTAAQTYFLQDWANMFWEKTNDGAYNKEAGALEQYIGDFLE